MIAVNAIICLTLIFLFGVSSLPVSDDYSEYVLEIRSRLKAAEMMPIKDWMHHDEFNIADAFGMDVLQGMAVLGEEEVTSLVIDIGCHSIKAGFSGEDHPRVVVPSAAGVFDKDRAPVVDEIGLMFPHAQMKVVRPVTESTIDFKLLEALLNYVVVEKLGVRWSEYPVLLVDGCYWTKEMREEMIQLMFGRFDVPAVYLGKTPVLATFATGKHTALVVDCGASGVSVVPVYDGYVIKSGMIHQPLLGGHSITQQCRVLLQEELKVDLTTPQEIQRKTLVDLGAAPILQLKAPSLADSYRNFHSDRIAEEWKETVAQVAEVPFNEIELAKRPPKYFEFPTGYNRNFGLERFRIGEMLFQPAKYRFGETGASVLGVSDLILRSINQCDADLRSILFGTIILAGGGSSFSGLSERLNSDLNRAQHSGRVRVQVGATVSERRFGAWVGGSILASLGSFSQLWLTRQEYKEHGASYIERKCI